MDYGGLGSPNSGLTLGLDGAVRMEGITSEADVGYVQAAMMQDLQQQQLMQQQQPLPPQPEEPMGLESHFQFLPLIIEILRHMSTIANQKDLKTDQEKIYEKQLRDKVKPLKLVSDIYRPTSNTEIHRLHQVVALNEKFKWSQVILEELEGTELTRQQQQEVRIEVTDFASTFVSQTRRSSFTGVSRKPRKATSQKVSLYQSHLHSQDLSLSLSFSHPK